MTAPSLRQTGALNAMAAEHLALTGRQSFCYLSVPKPGENRFVFTDTVCLTFQEAMDHMTALLAAAREEAAR